MIPGEALGSYGLLSIGLLIVGICSFVHNRRHNHGAKMTGDQRYGVALPIIFGTIGILLILSSPSLH